MRKVKHAIVLKRGQEFSQRESVSIFLNVLKYSLKKYFTISVLSFHKSKWCHFWFEVLNFTHSQLSHQGVTLLCVNIWPWITRFDFDRSFISGPGANSHTLSKLCYSFYVSNSQITTLSCFFDYCQSCNNTIEWIWSVGLSSASKDFCGSCYRLDCDFTFQV